MHNSPFVLLPPGQLSVAIPPTMVVSHVMFHLSSCSNGQSEIKQLLAISMIYIVPCI